MPDITELDAQENTEESTSNSFTLDGAIDEIRKLRKEAAEYRVKAKELQTTTVQLEEKLKASESTYSEKTSSYETELRNLKLQLQLSDKVIDAAKALKLVEEKHLKDGQLDVDAFLEENPFLAKQKASVPPLNTGTGAKNQNITAANWFEHLKQ